jgi:hypothetical protein
MLQRPTYRVHDRDSTARRGATFETSDHAFYRHRPYPTLRGSRIPSEVGRQQNVRRSEEWVPFNRRLVSEHVKSSTSEATALQRDGKRLLID